MSKFYQKGITITELLIVFAVIGILVSVTLPQFSKMKENQVLKNTVSDVTSIFHSTQSQSLASLDSSEYGVHFQSDRIIVFKGKVFSVDALDNKTINIISPASISNVTLGGISGTTGDMYFERLSGSPSKTGTVTISTPSFSKIVTISTTGAVSIN
jgi:Tfp pilus assembly protein FimT